MNGSLWLSVSDLGSAPFSATILFLGSRQVLSKNHVSLSAGGLLRRRDLFCCHVPRSLLLEKTQLGQPHILSPQTQADPPDLKLNYLSTARSEILSCKNGVPQRLSHYFGNLSPSLGRSVTKTLLSTMASILRPPTKWSSPLLISSIPSVLAAIALHIWDMLPSEPLPPPDPPDPPDPVPGYYTPETVTLQPHSQHLQCGAEQRFMGKLKLFGLSKSINECCLLCSSEVQSKFHVYFAGPRTEGITLIKQPSTATKITSSSTPLIHIPERQKLVSNSPVTLTSLVKFIQTFSRQGRERSLSTSSSKERIVPSNSLFTRGDPLLLSSSPLGERITLPCSLYYRGETYTLSLQVLKSSALALALRVCL